MHDEDDPPGPRLNARDTDVFDMFNCLLPRPERLSRALGWSST